MAIIVFLHTSFNLVPHFRPQLRDLQNPSKGKATQCLIISSRVKIIMTGRRTQIEVISLSRKWIKAQPVSLLKDSTLRVSLGRVSFSLGGCGEPAGRQSPPPWQSGARAPADHREVARSAQRPPPTFSLFLPLLLFSPSLGGSH